MSCYGQITLDEFKAKTSKNFEIWITQVVDHFVVSLIWDDSEAKEDFSDYVLDIDFDSVESAKGAVSGLECKRLKVWEK